jgi:hypothetical protein
VASVQADNVLGAEITRGDTRDLALFALDLPDLAAAGVKAKGRSCFIRKVGGKVTKAVLHNGANLSVDGRVLLDTAASGTVVLTFTDSGVQCILRMYDADSLRLRADRAPARVLLNGKPGEFTYDAAAQLVDIAIRGTREVKIEY